MARDEFNVYKDYLDTAKTLESPIPRVYYYDAIHNYAFYGKEPTFVDPISNYPDAIAAFEKTKVLIDTRK